ncbi:nuclear transport factor 2 family protein [Mucilaginibacter sp.]|uniref:nuclear transport factor 2 family protein n=1 Tax=Mucilaginibacter sp. TaxID=1882438 RepID=UPI0025DAF671|nr:nuclear transport factor 2 family protein [Mucilaginibacter sp.]
MNKKFILLFVVIIALCANNSFAQLASVPLASQKILLQSSDPKLAANKKLVYDCWREVLEAGHLELADKYLAETYMQHNPNVPTGRKGFVELFSKFAQPKPIVDTIKAPIVAIVAEGDLVVISFAGKFPDPADSTKTYTSTWFDMFRIENGKLAEHWDGAQKTKN